MFARCALVIAACAVIGVVATLPPVVSPDFSADITIQEGLETLHGTITYDTTAQRWYSSVKELNQSTYSFQPWGTTTVYTFTMTTSGCTCEIARSASVANYFGELFAATKSTKGCSGGDLYDNSMFPGLKQAGVKAFCVSGTTPKYVIDGTTKTVFSSFKAGRSAFPVEPLASKVQQCQDACL
jgi:hypothetical protein